MLFIPLLSFTVFGNLWRIDAFELWCWRRLLRVPWTARRSNQSIMKEISPGISLEGMMLRLKLQYFGHLMQSWLIVKDSDAGRDWGQEEKGTTEDEVAGWHHWLDGHGVSVNSGSWWWTGRPGVLRFMGSPRVRHDWATDLIWSDLNATFKSIKAFSDQHKEFLLSVSSLVQGRELTEGKPFLTLLSGKK